MSDDLLKKDPGFYWVKLDHRQGWIPCAWYGNHAVLMGSDMVYMGDQVDDWEFGARLEIPA